MAQPPPTPRADPADRLLGASPAIAALRAQIHHLATFDTLGGAAVPTVLLSGETGTGKGLVARLLHEHGPRAAGPFVEVNCAAIPETLLEAELFGFAAGAFTDAKRAKPGLFQVASGGTLFLDEIDALPLALQGKFLTAIEGKRVRSLGTVAEHPVDVKLIAATHAALGALVAEGRFRADLYYRLAVVPLEVPPLRARGEDIGLLAQHYLRQYAEAHSLRPKRLSPAAEVWLRRHAWPGNVRELSHLMERVTLLHPEPLIDAPALERLCLPQLPPEVHAEVEHMEISAPADEAAQIQQALAQTQGNVAQAARRLGWSRKALRYRMQQHGIAPTGRSRGRPPRAAHRDQGPTATPSGELPAWAPGGEQKPIAVLAIELTFPEASDTTPASEPWTAARRWERTMEEKVRGFGGTLVQRAPSLWLVAFGLPRTLEQLPQRAIQTALALRHIAAEAQVVESEALGPTLRQAVHWGQVLVDVEAREPAQRLLPLGDTVALPVRLLGKAGSGDIVLSPALARLVVGWCELDELPPPGTEPPARASAYRVRGLVPRRSPLARLGAQALSPCVGRERELAALQTLLAAVEGGWGQAVGMVGEPGVGKSRLLLEFRRRLAGRRVTYLEGRCLAYGSTTPYLPVLDLLRDNCGITEADTPAQVAEKVCLALQEVMLDPDERAPYLLHLLGLPEAIERVEGLSPEVLTQRTVETLWQLSLQGSQRRPLILAIEDLQWVDPSSADFFTMLVGRLAGAPILFLATYRPGYRPPWLGQSYATQLALPPLAPPDSRRVVQAVSQAAPLPEPLVQVILAKAQGNPFFLEEIVQAVVEQRPLVRDPDAGTGDTPPRIATSRPDLEIPATVQGVLAARIDRLPAEAKALLQTLAVIGHAGSFRLLTRLVERPGGELHRLLAQLQDAEFVYEQPNALETVYTFKHALTRDVAYAMLPLAWRQALHERTAQAIEALWSHRLEEQYGELAYHYSRSRNTAQAVTYLQRAGQQAVERSAHIEAIAYLTQGLDLLMTLPETPERTQQELDVQLALGPALMASKGFAAAEVERTYARARILCQQLGDVPQLFPALFGLWRFSYVGAQLQTARKLGEQLLSLAERQQDPALGSPRGAVADAVHLGRADAGPDALRAGHQTV